jgi:hypothetical protein
MKLFIAIVVSFTFIACISSAPAGYLIQIPKETKKSHFAICISAGNDLNENRYCGDYCYGDYFYMEFAGEFKPEIIFREFVQINEVERKIIILKPVSYSSDSREEININSVKNPPFTIIFQPGAKAKIFVFDLNQGGIDLRKPEIEKTYSFWPVSEEEDS